MDLYLKHSRKYLSLLRKVIEVGHLYTSYYDWSGKVKVEGKYLSVAIAYIKPTPWPGIPPHRFTIYDRNHTRVFSTDSIREFVSQLQSLVPVPVMSW